MVNNNTGENSMNIHKQHTEITANLDKAAQKLTDFRTELFEDGYNTQSKEYKKASKIFEDIMNSWDEISELYSEVIK